MRISDDQWCKTLAGRFAQIAGMHSQADLRLCGAHMLENTFVVHLMTVLFDNSESRHSIVFIYGNTLGKDTVLDHSPPKTPTKVRMTRNDIIEKYTNENSTNKTKYNKETTKKKKKKNK